MRFVFFVILFAALQAYATEPAQVRAPASWALSSTHKKGEPTTQGEQMLNEVTQPHPFEGRQPASVHMVGTCQTSYGVNYESHLDARGYERCQDDPNRLSGGAALFSLPN